LLRSTGILVAVAFIGFAMLVATAEKPANFQPPDGTFLPFVAQAVESWHPAAVILLGALGFAAGWLFKPVASSSTAPPVLFAALCGLSSVAGFFAWSMADMVFGSAAGHNLWPIEWLIYLGLGIPAFVGAALGIKSTWSTT